MKKFGLKTIQKSQKKIQLVGQTVNIPLQIIENFWSTAFLCKNVFVEKNTLWGGGELFKDEKIEVNIKNAKIVKSL